jgi:heterodisulfide reductase subunit A/quinone-modifying oxidoreductase subunit QmoB
MILLQEVRALKEQEKKIAIFLCGCNGEVSKVIDLAALKEAVKGKKDVVATETHEFVCGSEGMQLIESTVKASGANAVLVAGCPGTIHTQAYKELAAKLGINPWYVFRADIREGSALPHKDNPAAATIKAKNLVNMELAKARLQAPYEPKLVPGINHCLVIGSGVAGLAAAQDMLHAGAAVTLIEKNPYLGGRVAQLSRVFPMLCDSACGLSFRIDKIKKDPRARIMAATQVAEVVGAPGAWDATLETLPQYIDPARCIDCGKCAEVCPVEVPNEFNFGLDKRKAAYKMAYSCSQEPVYFIDPAACKGEECKKCAEACPAGAIDLTKQATRETVSAGAIINATGWKPYDVERVERLGFGRIPAVITNMQMERICAPDGPTNGRLVRPHDGKPIKSIGFVQCAGSRDEDHLPYCSTICCTATLKHTLYVKDKAPEAQPYVFFMEMRSIGEYEDMYREAQKNGTVFIRSNPAEVREDTANGGVIVQGEDTGSGERYEIPLDMLVLATGMVPNEQPKALQDMSLLTSDYNFFIGHKQCFPYETYKGGLFMAGTCQEPMDMTNSVRSADGAVGKSLAVVGRELEILPNWTQVEINKCDQCERCMEECPFKVWHYVVDAGGKKQPLPNLLACRQCGICMGGCPKRAIRRIGYDVFQMIKMAIEPKESVGEGEPTIMAFMCENDALRAAEQAARMGKTYPPNILIVPVPCAGSVNMVVASEGFMAGLDGVIVVGCYDNECHFLKGSAKANERVVTYHETLKEMLIETERLKFINLGIREVDKFLDEINAFVETIRKLPPNPFKSSKPAVAEGGVAAGTKKVRIKCGEAEADVVLSPMKGGVDYAVIWINDERHRQWMIDTLIEPWDQTERSTILWSEEAEPVLDWSEWWEDH